MTGTVQKWGNSLAIRIPKALSQESGLIEGTQIDIALSNGKLVISKARPVYSIDELVARITLDNKPDFNDVDFGKPMGRET